MWITRHRCKKCNTYMSWDTMMHSRGTCPHCGANDGSTIINCEDVPHKVISWWNWKFPFKHVRYISKEDLKANPELENI